MKLSNTTIRRLAACALPALLACHLTTFAQTGTFYSASHPSEPPMPFNRFPELPLTFLGGTSYMVDDTSVDFSRLAAQLYTSIPDFDDHTNIAPFEVTLPPPNYGCGFWVEAGHGTNGALLILHNTRSNQTYTVLSTTNLTLPRTNWTAETNLLGNSGDVSALLSIGGRSNLFLGVSMPQTEYAINTNSMFVGIQYIDDYNGEGIPDTMGAVGPNHFVELLNGGKIAVYSKTGVLLESANSSNFFTMTYSNISYPLSNCADSRILYDASAQRWVAATLDFPGSGNLILAVSATSSPTNLITGWNRKLY